MIRGLLFDLNGTVIDIRTDEEDFQVYRVTANFLDYHGVRISPEELKEQFFTLNRQQRKNSPEKFPEFDAVRIFREIILSARTSPGHLPPSLAAETALVFRAASRRRLEPYPDVPEVLNELSRNYALAAVSDGQLLWALPELRSAGLEQFFSFSLISGDLGFRKPDPRMFEIALDQMNLSAAEAVFVGNDMFRDIYGAHQAGMKTVFFKSNQGDQNHHGADPDYVIRAFRELPQAVSFLNAQPE